MPILDPLVSRAKFTRAVREVEAEQGRYEGVWRLRRAAYPHLLVDVMSGPDMPLFTLWLGMENWDFLPPTATLLDLSLMARMPPGSVPGTVEDLGAPVNHLVASPNAPGLWFCSPGFYEYHSIYADDRWEMVRGTAEGGIVRIIERACDLIDRHAAAAGPAAPAIAPARPGRAGG